MDSRRRAVATLGATLALTCAPAAHGAVDYSKNSATGDYAPALTPAPVAASADSPDEGFAWGDAAVGAGAALAAAALLAAPFTIRQGSMSKRSV